LRLAVLLNAPIDVVQHLFDFVWRDGKSPTNDDAFDQLLDQYNVSADELNSNDVKQALRQNTEEAIQRGVFGVPTCVVGEQKFWGYDATDMVHAALGDDPFYQSPQWLAARAMPDGVHRKEVA
jgi:2-hydroxychromene-2-carboxylate isomerase